LIFIKQPSASSELPTLKEQRLLAAESMDILIDAINTRDCNKMHAAISIALRSVVTVEDLEKSILEFSEHEMKFSNLAQVTPTFTEEPFIDDDHLFQLKGYYPANPTNIQFRFTYIYEGIKWKFAGFNLRVKPANMLEEIG